MKQYRVIDKTTGKLKGYIVGKTPNHELVLNLGNRTFCLKITPKNEARYIIEVLEVGGAQ